MVLDCCGLAQKHLQALNIPWFLGQVTAMLKTCANPGCGAKFLYLRHGVLFTFRSRQSFTGAAINVPEWFWLCRECSQTVTLVFDPVNGRQAIRK
jgi:hypothetical protein